MTAHPVPDVVPGSRNGAWRRVFLRPGLATLLIAALAGLSVGALTSPAQTLLGDTVLSGLTNAVAPWLMAPFFVGSLARRWITAAGVGLVACVAQVPGYYLVSAARGYSASATWVLVWCIAGLIGGIVLGVAGWSWRHSSGRWRGCGAAMLIAGWLTEGTVTFGFRLGYVSDAVVSTVVAAVLFAVLGLRGAQHRPIARWLLPTVAAGVLGQWLLPVLLDSTPPDIPQYPDM